VFQVARLSKSAVAHNHHGNAEPQLQAPVWVQLQTGGTHDHERKLVQPLMPVMAMPRMKVLRARRKSTIRGSENIMLAAINTFHGVPPCWL
jgi:hypothetical protein